MPVAETPTFAGIVPTRIPESRTRPHIVAVVALEGVNTFDLANPCEIFGHVRLADGHAPYRIRVCGLTPTVRAGAFAVRAPYGIRGVAGADTVIVPGIEDATRPVPAVLIRALRAAHARGARIASICSGAFVLAAAGLLDGRRATTHWLAAAELARRHPAVDVDPNVLYVDDGPILTSAGAAAGMDLCLHIVRRDHGAAVAAHGARLAVMPLERAGGQAQFITHEPPRSDGASLEPLLRWMETHHAEPLTLPRIARQAAMSARSLSRRFREQTGDTPARWLVRRRVRHAQQLLESSAASIEEIADAVGFGSTATFRERFGRIVGTSPQAYRRTFRQRVSA
jgi:transcriptional regulator GlxA family with amidase domain